MLKTFRSRVGNRSEQILVPAAEWNILHFLLHFWLYVHPSVKVANTFKHLNFRSTTFLTWLQNTTFCPFGHWSLWRGRKILHKVNAYPGYKDNRVFGMRESFKSASIRKCNSHYEEWREWRESVSWIMRSSVLGQRGQAALLVVSGNAVHFICLQSLQMSTFLDFQFYHLNMDIDVELPISIYKMHCSL